MTYNSALYIDDNVYFFHTMTSLEGDSYIDGIVSYEKTTRTKQEAEHEYKELCFVMDKLYGRPQRAAVAESMTEKGFDRTLDEYSDKTREAKELLRSESLSDMLIGLANIEDIFFDGGHTMLFVMPFNQLMAKAPKSALTAALSTNPGLQDIAPALTGMQIVQDTQAALGELRTSKYKAYELVKEWQDTSKAALYKKDDTVVFAFDSYINEAVYDFKWALDYAADNEIKRFVIDDSCNMGGNSAVANYMFAMMTNKDKDDNTACERYMNKLTGNIQNNDVLLDLDLNGEINDLDKQVYYDFEYAVITSSISYSSGNYFPCLAKSAGIPILGEKSGGGGCMMVPLYNSENLPMALSFYMNLIDKDGNDVDKGAEVDYDLTTSTTDENGAENIDSSGLYDIDGYKGLIDEYYEGRR